jgi:hypothetical protein
MNELEQLHRTEVRCERAARAWRWLGELVVRTAARTAARKRDRPEFNQGVWMGMLAATHGPRLIGWFARSAFVLFATLATGCVATFPVQSTGVITFADTVNAFDVVPPGWITPDGNTRNASTVGTNGEALAFVFPSLLLDQETTQTAKVSIPDFLGGDSGFKGGSFHYAPAAEAQSAIEIATVRSSRAIVIDIEPPSMSRILQLPLDRFRRLQAAYAAWLFRQCSYLAHCFSPTAGEALRGFWKNEVLREASFKQFADRNLNPPAPMMLRAFDAEVFATRIAPRQQLSITWGNNNFYPDNGKKGGTATLNLSYSRTTSGGNTRVQILDDAGRMRLFPALRCGIADIRRKEPKAPDDAMIPYSDQLRALFPKWVMPVYNLFDLNNPYLLTAPERTSPIPTDCRGGARQAPPNLFLLAPSTYVKPDNWTGIGQFETEGGLGSNVDPKDEYLVLTRQFVILACDSSVPSEVEKEWRRLLNAARGNDESRGACGMYLHGVFGAKTFVELRNRFSYDGRPVEDGVAHFTGIGQAVGPSLGSRLNFEAAPGSKPLLDLLRVQPARNRRRVLLRFYTTMAEVLDQAAVLEGDDIHAISVREILR